MADFSFEDLTQKLRATNARWQLKQPAVFKPVIRHPGLGYIPHPEEHSRGMREMLGHLNAALYRAGAASAAVPAAFDWHNVNNQNFVTPAKDQGQCNSCVAFAVAAAVELMVRTKARNALLPISLSPAQLFFCQAAAQGITCSPTSGWNLQDALGVVRDVGVADEACFPYTDHDQACAVTPDWATRVTKISAFHTVSNFSAIREWLSSRGPLLTAFSLYSDFRDYWNAGNGIYNHVKGDFEGLHCVCCVGYNDANDSWICKNSWGPATGPRNDGCFNIAYGECGIDSTMWAIDGIQ